MPSQLLVNSSMPLSCIIVIIILLITIIILLGISYHNLSGLENTNLQLYNKLAFKNKLNIKNKVTSIIFPKYKK